MRSNPGELLIARSNSAEVRLTISGWLTGIMRNSAGASRVRLQQFQRMPTENDWLLLVRGMGRAGKNSLSTGDDKLRWDQIWDATGYK